MISSLRSPVPAGPSGSRAIGIGVRSLMTTSLMAALVLVPLASQGSAAETPPSIFDIRIEAAPFVNKIAAVTVIPLPLGNGITRSSVSMNSQPFVISQAAVVYSPLAETVLAAQPDASRLAFCYSYFPTGPGSPAEASCGGGGVLPADVGVEAGSGHTATTGDASDPTTLQSRSSAKGVGVSAAANGLPVPLTVGNVASAADSRAVDDRMAGAGSTELNDIDIAGVLTIRSLRSSVSGALSGDPGEAAVERDFAVSGAAVGGQPVEIDENGVHAVGQPVAPMVGGSEQEQINEALAAAGVRVAVVPATEPEIRDDGTRLQASSDALRIEFNNFQTGVLTEFDLGAVDVAMQASRQGESSGTSSTGDVGDVAAQAPEEPTLEGSASPTPAVTDRTGSSTPPTPPPAPHPGAGAGDPTREVAQVVSAGAPGQLWDLAYAPFALFMLALPFALNLRRSSSPMR